MTTSTVLRTVAAATASTRPTMRVRLRHYSGDGLALLAEKAIDAVSTADALGHYMRLEGLDTEATEDSVRAAAHCDDDDRVVVERREMISGLMTAQIEVVAVP